MCSTMSLQQSVSLVVFLGIFTIFSFCQCSDYTEGEDYIQKIQNSKAHVNKLASLLAEELLREENDPTKGKGKGLFCRGFGCVVPTTTTPASQQKRVFCNGFFGCTNGRKRAQSVDLEPLNYPDVELDNQPDFRKRLFCNPTGCFRKRATYRGYEKFLEKLGKTGNMAGN